MTENSPKLSAGDDRRLAVVLIVEDNPDGRESLRTLLRLCGYEVEAAADGVEGVEKGLVLRPRVALVDIGLPRLDGYEVARQLREAMGTGIRLLACTAYGEPEVRCRALEAGFDAVMVKPLDLRRLAAWIEEALGPGGASVEA